MAVCWFRAEGLGETAIASPRALDVQVEIQAPEREKTSTDRIGPELYTAMGNKAGKIILGCLG